MRTLILMLFLMLLSSESCHAASPVAADQLKVNSNGTATVTGVVLENNNGCATDGECYLRIQAGNLEVRVVYIPSETPGQPKNHEATEIAGKVKKDAHVEVYGKHSKEGILNIIEIYSSKDFYVHVLND